MCSLVGPEPARPARRLALACSLLALAVLGGCRSCPEPTHKVIACLGDSNTHQPEQTSWCDLLAQEAKDSPLRFLNYGFPGGAVLPPAPRFPVLDASYWLDRALVLTPPAVVILAFGTNDLRYNMQPADVLQAYKQTKERAEKAGARTLVALAPPMGPKRNDKSAEVVELNKMLRETFPPQDIIDFNTGFDLKTDLTPDGIHFTEAGQRKRAQVVRRALQANGFAVPSPQS